MASQHNRCDVLTQHLPQALQRAVDLQQQRLQRSAHALGLLDPQLVLQRGQWQGRPLLPETWVAAMTTPRARMPDGTDYGYLWWLHRFPGELQTQAMNGAGGNTVQVIPALDAVVVITTTNFNVPQPHRNTFRIMTEHVVPALRLAATQGGN